MKKEQAEQPEMLPLSMLPYQKEEPEAEITSGSLLAVLMPNQLKVRFDLNGQEETNVESASNSENILSLSRSKKLLAAAEGSVPESRNKDGVKSINDKGVQGKEIYSVLESWGQDGLIAGKDKGAKNLVSVSATAKNAADSVSLPEAKEWVGLTSSIEAENPGSNEKASSVLNHAQHQQENDRARKRAENNQQNKTMETAAPLMASVTSATAASEAMTGTKAEINRVSTHYPQAVDSQQNTQVTNENKLTYAFSDWGKGLQVEVQLSDNKLPHRLTPSDGLVQQRLADYEGGNRQKQPEWVFSGQEDESDNKRRPMMQDEEEA
ncbi:hypothetical protein [Kalamiella sp. sgz302252]|uniref:SpaN/EivJ family type III secretion system needle length determinant n=1 Tax=Pantoea sp. sgz302252 TaxID=3341827 RepID=UPI0036D2569B